jgi:UDP-N-acetylglucosamine 2-epimerase (hydrolysing)
LSKKILFITGTRADFGKLKPLLRAVEESRELSCNIFVTGMHLLKRYGATHDEVRKSGFKNIYLFINQIANVENNQMDMVLGKTIEGLGHYIREFKIDLIIVHGDRVEALAGAVVGALNNILVCHIEGGELSGTVDELIRHAITKLSNVHFVANSISKKRLLQMGESDKSVFITGSPEVDIMLSDSLPNMLEVKKRYDISFDSYNIFIYHPVTTELNTLQKKIKIIVNALVKSGENFIVVYPNNDVGSNIIFSQLETIKENKNFKFFPSIRFEYYISLMKNAKRIIGNSSAGVREASVFGIPSINIGTRQNNRVQHPSIINIDENEKEILKAINEIPKIFIPSLNFGRGNSAKSFIQTISKKSFWKISNQKQFKDILEDERLNS